MANEPQKTPVGTGNWNEENPRKVAKRQPIGRVSNRAPGRGKSIFSGAEIISMPQNDAYREGWEKVYGEKDRFKMECPKCTVGRNTTEFGGTKNCFHCHNCSYVECAEIGHEG